MAEQQLIDYIKKAREAGQADDQTRDLLSKNGWTNIEINEAIMAVASGSSQTIAPAQPQTPVQPTVQPEPETFKPQPIAQPETKIQEEPEVKLKVQEIEPQIEAQSQPQPQQPVVQPEIKPEAFDISKITAQSQPVIQPEMKMPAQPEPEPEPEPQPIVQTQYQEPQPVVVQPEPQMQAKPQPVAQPQYQPSFEQENLPRMRGGFSGVLKVLMVLIILIALGGVGYFTAGQYFNLPYSNLLLSFFTTNPQSVINKMVANMKDVKASHTIMQLNASTTSNNTLQGNLVINTNSEMDRIDPKDVKASGNFTLNITTPASASPVVESTVSMVALGDTYYVKVNDLIIPSSYISSVSPELDISKIKGKWFKIDQDSIKAISNVSGQGTVANISQGSNSVLMQKIQDLMITENLLSFNKQLSDENIGGQDTYHYLVTVDKTKLQDFINKSISLSLQEAAKVQNNTVTNASGTASVPTSSPAVVENMIQAGVKTFVDAIGDINMEVWIGKKDFMLYQVKLDKTIDLNKIAQAYGATSTSTNAQVAIKLNITNSNFNKAVTTQAPEGAQKIEEILLPLAKIQKVNTDIKQIGYDASYIHSEDKSYATLCSRGLLNGYQKTYGADLVQLHTDIVSQIGQKPVCFAGVNDYCISTQLSASSWMCIDKSGKVGSTRCLSYNTICK